MADLDDSTRNSALFNWKAVADLNDVLKSLLVTILWEGSIDPETDLAKSRLFFLHKM